MLTIRAATEADAAAVALAAERFFRLLHADDTSRTDIDQYCAAHFGADLQLAEMRSPGITYFLAVLGDQIVGYVQLGLDRHPPVELSLPAARYAEAKRVYVDPGYHGSGLAARLMETAFTHTRAAGADLIWLSVWKKNLRAIAFYEKMGLAAHGEASFQLGSDLQEDWIMAKPQ